MISAVVFVLPVALTKITSLIQSSISSLAILTFCLWDGGLSIFSILADSVSFSSVFACYDAISFSNPGTDGKLGKDGELSVDWQDSVLICIWI